MALTDKLSAIGNVIRAITGKSAKLTLDEMPAEIKRVETEFIGMIDESVTEITVPPGVTRTRWYAFAYCTNLKKVTLPDGFEKITKNAFYQCTSLESIVIPSSVITISTKAFLNCTKLKRIICLAEDPPKIYTDTFDELPADYVIEVPADSVGAYKAATNWAKIADHICEINAVVEDKFYIMLDNSEWNERSFTSGMTWSEYIDSEYNEDEFWYDERTHTVFVSSFGALCMEGSENKILKDYKIIRGQRYDTVHIGGGA